MSVEEQLQEIADRIVEFRTRDAKVDVARRLVETTGSASAEEIAACGFQAGLVRSVVTMVEKAEYKRRQAPPVLKVSPKAFGTGRRIPIARRFS